MQRHHEFFDAVLDAVAESELFLSHCRIQPPSGYAAALEVTIDVEGRCATLHVVLPWSFPLVLPRIYLHPWDALGFIPHVLYDDGYICYVDATGLIIDRDRPAAVVEQSVQRVVDLLVAGVRGPNRADFVDEFESYWNRLPHGERMASVLDPHPVVQRVAVARREDGVAFVAAEESDLSSFWNGRSVPGPLKLSSALYLPMEPGTTLVPPRPDRRMWTAAETRDFMLSGLSSENTARLTSLLKVRGRRDPEYVFVSLPRFAGGTNLFGIRYERVGQAHPLGEGGSADRLVPLQLFRWDRSYLVPRGGANENLAAKRVLLAGCGAVGGNLAFELVRAGILHLTVVDDDSLDADNSFRHVLGRRYWGKNKAEALKAEIEANLPYARVRAVASTIEAAIRNGSVDPTQFDIVLFALGNPTVELAMTEHLQALRSIPPAVVTWVEPFGLGGHALLTGNAGSSGCFRCLFTSPEGESQLTNRASFAVPDPQRPFSRALSGCGSLHTPYSAIDAVRTSNLAARLALDALIRRESGNPLHSWKGDPTEYLAAGHVLSDRFDATEEQLHRLRYEYRVPDCPVCYGQGEGAQ